MPKPTESPDRQKAVEAVRVLNYLLGDLLAGWHSYFIFHSPPVEQEYQPELRRSFTRMSLAWVALGLAKWVEFYDHYKALIPQDCKAACKKLRQELHDVELKRFRNVMVGHIIDKKSRRALTKEEMRSQLEKVMGQNAGGFLHWIKRLDGRSDPAISATVVDIVEVTRNRLISIYGLGEEEIFERNDTGV